MRHPFTPTNIDDAFVAGWNQGRGLTGDSFMVPERGTALHIAREFERGVSEGYEFQQNMDNRDMVLTVRGWERRP
jgi:hypothetical protein